MAMRVVCVRSAAEIMMITRLGLFRVLVAIGISLHFAMILVVVTHLNEIVTGLPVARPALAASDLYSQVTFSNRNFGFFAPSVTPDWNVDITTVTAKGERRAFKLPCPNREMEVRLYSMVGHFTQDDDTMDLFARSWAVYAMNHVDDAVRVDIAISRNIIPSMRQHRDGVRIDSVPMYRTTFELR